MNNNDPKPQKDTASKTGEPLSRLEQALKQTNLALSDIDTESDEHSAAVDALQNLEVACERLRDEHGTGGR